MTLYRAIYQRTDSTLRGMTFAALNASVANQVAEDWQLPSDRLLVVKALRPLAAQLELVP